MVFVLLASLNRSMIVGTLFYNIHWQVGIYISFLASIYPRSSLPFTPLRCPNGFPYLRTVRLIFFIVSFWNICTSTSAPSNTFNPCQIASTQVAVTPSLNGTGIPPCGQNGLNLIKLSLAWLVTSAMIASGCFLRIFSSFLRFQSISIIIA